MTKDQISVIEKCAEGSLTGTLTFPEIIGKLQAVDVERYHADYCRSEITYYTPAGKSHVVSMLHPAVQIAKQFSAAGVEAAVRASQRGEHTYIDFLRKTMAAGCVGYFVQIAGRRAQYFGRNGEIHLEPFPSAD